MLDEIIDKEKIGKIKEKNYEYLKEE